MSRRKKGHVQTEIWMNKHRPCYMTNEDGEYVVCDPLPGGDTAPVSSYRSDKDIRKSLKDVRKSVKDMRGSLTDVKKSIEDVRDSVKDLHEELDDWHQDVRDPVQDMLDALRTNTRNEDASVNLPDKYRFSRNNEKVDLSGQSRKNNQIGAMEMEEMRIHKIVSTDAPHPQAPSPGPTGWSPMNAEPVRLTVTTGRALTVPNEIPVSELAVGKEVSLTFNSANVECIVAPCETLVPFQLPGGGMAKVSMNQIWLTGTIPYCVAFAVGIPAQGTNRNPGDAIDFVLSSTGTAYVENVVYYTDNPLREAYPDVRDITGKATISNIVPVLDGTYIIVVDVSFELPSYRQ